MLALIIKRFRRQGTQIFPSFLVIEVVLRGVSQPGPRRIVERPPERALQLVPHPYEVLVSIFFIYMGHNP